jgi:dissimilatory sulfite reductase (desulfoviridin) alpha/beta subunit
MNEKDLNSTYTINVCRGLTGCPSAIGPSLDLKTKLDLLFEQVNFANSFQKKNQPGKHHRKQFRISISCCPNGCSMPHIADIGIIFAGPVEITSSTCSNCLACVKVCLEKAISCEKDKPPIISQEKCLQCSKCAEVCQSGTIKKLDVGFRILVGGKLGRHPRLATEFEKKFDLPQTLNIVKNALKLFLDNLPEAKRFADLFDIYSEQEIYRKLVD